LGCKVESTLSHQRSTCVPPKSNTSPSHPSPTVEHLKRKISTFPEVHENEQSTQTRQPSTQRGGKKSSNRLNENRNIRHKYKRPQEHREESQSRKKA